MAITKVSPGLLDLDSGITITTADNSDNLTLTSTDADANVAPNLRMYRNSSSPADSDQLGKIQYEGRNDNSQDVIYGEIGSQIKDASDGTEDGRVFINTMVAGSLQSRMNILETEVVFNEESNDQDFRVESNNEAYMLFVDGGNDRVGINTSDPATTLEVDGVITIKGTTGSDGINFETNNQRIYYGGHRLLEGSTSTTGTIGLGESYTGDVLINPRIKATRGIVFGSDTATVNTLDDYEEGTWTARYSAATGGVIGGTQVSDAHYVKIGKLVLIEFTLYISGIDVTGKSGIVTITGLPFNSASSYGPSEVRTTNNTSIFGVFTNPPERISAEVGALSLWKARSSGVEQELEVTDFATAGGNRNVLYIRHAYRT